MKRPDLQKTQQDYNLQFYYLSMTGPTSFAPIIEMAMTIVEQSGGQYHVLLIIADGQVMFCPRFYSFCKELYCRCECNLVLNMTKYTLPSKIMGKWQNLSVLETIKK